MFQSYNAKKFYNLKDTKDNLIRIGARGNADPPELCYFICEVQPQDLVSPFAVRLTMVVTYKVRWSNRLDIPPS